MNLSLKKQLALREKTVKSYSDAIGLLRGQGLKYTDVDGRCIQDPVSKIAIEIMSVNTS